MQRNTLIIRNLVTSLFIIVPLIACDQISKWLTSQYIFNQPAPVSWWDWIITAPQRTGFGSIEMTSFFNIVMVWNQGVSFGLFNHDSTYGPLLLILLSLLVTAIFIVWLTKADHPIQISGLIFVISGALGNVIDRARFGAVIDFIDIHINGYHWPAFNLADSFIFIGVCFLLIHSLFYDQDRL